MLAFPSEASNARATVAFQHRNLRGAAPHIFGLRGALQGWEAVRSRSFAGDEVRRLAESPPPGYRLLLQVCLLLFEGLAPDLTTGRRRDGTCLRRRVRAVISPGW